MTDAKPLPRKLPHTSPDAAAEARAQADEYESLFGDTELELDGGDTIKIPPHPDYGLLDDDRMDEYEALQFAVDTEYEREPDVYIPEQRLKDPTTGEETGVVLPPQTVRGQLKVPYRIDGVRVTPSHSTKVVIAALGEAEYKRLRDGGKSSKDVWKVWGEQSLRIQERKQRDTKSAGSSVDLATVPQADSK
jgi:hypothetical protein